MTLKEFFKIFDLLADAPNAIEEMRGLILEFAVKGRLISRSSEWRTDALKNLTTKIGSGATPLGGRESYVAKGIPLIRSMNVYYSGFDSTGLVFLTKEQAAELANVEVQTNDVLFNITGASIGRVTVAPAEMNGARVNQHVTIIRPTPFLLPRFLTMFLASPSAQRMINEIEVGATRQALTKGMIEQFEIPLPELAEQKRIVAKVDELMALCDRLEAQQQERETRHARLAKVSLVRFAEAPTPANLNLLFHKSFDIDPADLRKSILTLAVQGKLVPQDPKDEPAQDLLASIAADVTKAINRKLIRKRAVDIFEGEFPFDLPDTWLWTQLGHIVAVEDGAMCDGPFGSKLKTEHYIEDRGFAVVRLGNIGIGGFIWGKEGHISRKHYESLQSNHIQLGDLLVAGLADPLVRCCQVPKELGPAVNKADCFRVRLDNRIIRDYVMHYLNSPIAKAFAAEENHGMTRQRINLANAKALPIPLPPLAEQRRIVAKVDQMMKLVDGLEKQLTESRARAAQLMEAVVAELTSKS